MQLNKLSNIILVSTVIALSAVAVFTSPSLHAESLLPPGSHCVAYKARKRLLLLASVNVVGKSCEVAAQITPEVGGKYRVEISFPIHTLKSGEDTRDQDVAKLLGAEQNPEMHFVTDPLTHEEWQALLKNPSGQLSGQLKIGDRSSPLNATINLVKGESGVEVDGVIKTSFKQLDLKPPQMALGLFAKVRDELELHFHLQGNRTMGVESIL